MISRDEWFLRVIRKAQRLRAEIKIFTNHATKAKCMFAIEDALCHVSSLRRNLDKFMVDHCLKEEDLG